MESEEDVSTGPDIPYWLFEELGFSLSPSVLQQGQTQEEEMLSSPPDEFESSNVSMLPPVKEEPPELGNGHVLCTREDLQMELDPIHAHTEGVEDDGGCAVKEEPADVAEQEGCAEAGANMGRSWWDGLRRPSCSTPARPAGSGGMPAAHAVDQDTGVENCSREAACADGRRSLPSASQTQSVPDRGQEGEALEDPSQKVRFDWPHSDSSGEEEDAMQVGQGRDASGRQSLQQVGGGVETGSSEEANGAMGDVNKLGAKHSCTAERSTLAKDFAIEHPDGETCPCGEDRVGEEDPSQDEECSCSTCGETFSQRGSLAEHLQRRHRWKKGLVCYKCGWKCDSFSSLGKHFRDVHPGGTKKFPCSECDQRFDSESELNYHLAFQHGIVKTSSPSDQGRKFL